MKNQKAYKAVDEVLDANVTLSKARDILDKANCAKAKANAEKRYIEALDNREQARNNLTSILKEGE